MSNTRGLTYGKRGLDAYLTLYLALSMTIMISLCLALIEGARSNAIRMETECVMEIGLQSILAEYHRELLQNYNLFAIDCSYGTDVATKLNTEHHLKRYIERNISTEDIFLDRILYRDFLAMELQEVKITKQLMLTDYEGAVLRRQAAEAVKDDVGLTFFDEVLNWMQVVETNDLLEMDVADWKESVDEELESYNGQQIETSEGEWITIDIQNPTGELEEIRKTGILSAVVEDTENLSKRCLNTNGLLSYRMEQGQINQGNMELAENSSEEDLIEQFLFLEYLLKYMGCYGDEDDSNALVYQLEYLLIGKDSDLENLKSSVNRLMAIREASNAVYIFSDQEKCAEAELAALLLCSLIQLPELAELLQVILLLAWAFAESLHDMEVLLQGGKVPLMKNKNSWYYSLENSLSGFQKNTNHVEGTGLTYKDHLRIMLMFTESKILTKRAMNLIETDIRKTPGNENFRLDACCVKVEAVIKMKSAYGYVYEITRTKEY